MEADGNGNSNGNINMIIQEEHIAAEIEEPSS
jgi:hypothetical protein